MEDHNINILIIDDDPLYLRLSDSILKDRFTVYTAKLPSAGLEILRTHNIDFVISDYRLPEMDGLQVIDYIKTNHPQVEVILISNSGDMDTVIEALRRGAIDYFKKPFSPADIWLSIERSIKYSELKQQYTTEKNKNQHLKSIVDNELGVEIIGSSRTIADIKNQMKMVAQTPDTSVLILGESGTGKELVARGIHNFSKRNAEFFGAVNMSAIPEPLFESEFFGHKKGSFTGAIADKTGWFETADKGTLFLDEIGEISPQIQVKLLRVLEDRTYTRVGTQQNQKFNIRIVAATNKPIEELMTGVNFRIDLYHRIGTFVIYLPPLRERKEDIPELIRYFTEKYAKRLGKNIDTIQSGVYELLHNYAFPGNIRELRNIIERAIILCPDNILRAEYCMLIKNSIQHNEVLEQEIFDLEEIEKKTIRNALKRTNGNKAEAARLLNIEWNALYRRMQKYHLEQRT